MQKTVLIACLYCMLPCVSQTMEPNNQSVINSEQMRNRIYRLSEQISIFQKLKNQTSGLGETEKKLFQSHNQLVKVDTEFQLSHITADERTTMLQSMIKELDKVEKQLLTIKEGIKTTVARL